VHLPIELAQPIVEQAIDKGPGKPMVGTARLASRIGDLDMIGDSKLYEALEQVFNAALPMLSRMRFPSLLLPGKLQTVVKAQRIFLQPGEEYEGVWHRDGKHESIVGAVLYYYGMSECLMGGELEFFDSQPLGPPLWVGGDCKPDSLTRSKLKSHVSTHPYQKVPLQQGSMVVFSNYQLLHRVLRMWNDQANDSEGSREFLVFFVVDQRAPLMSTTEYYADAYQNEHPHPSLLASHERRATLLEDQLKPVGKFGLSQQFVYSTGNGSAALLECVHGYSYSIKRMLESHQDCSGLHNLLALNQCPPQGRGISWAMEDDRTTEYDDDS
jgi:hypothetical protein